MLNIVIPMAGRGSRFVNEGYKDPKPLIFVHGKPMIQVVVENLRPARDHRFIFICFSQHLTNYVLNDFLTRLSPNSIVIPAPRVTEGAACTVLLAEQYIDNDAPLMIANCDQWIDGDIDRYLEFFDKCEADGVIMTMKANDSKWSYVGFDNAGNINRVVEKQVVSDSATVGIYNFKRGKDFVFSAKEMIAKNIRTNGEFYVAPVCNQMIAKGACLVHYSIGKEFAGMYGLGTPQDLEHFLSLPMSQRLAGQSRAVPLKIMT